MVESDNGKWKSEHVSLTHQHSQIYDAINTIATTSDLLPTSLPPSLTHISSLRTPIDPNINWNARVTEPQGLTCMQGQRQTVHAPFQHFRTSHIPSSWTSCALCMTPLTQGASACLRVPQVQLPPTTHHPPPTTHHPPPPTHHPPPTIH